MTTLTGRQVPPFKVVPLEGLPDGGAKIVVPDAFVGETFVIHFYNAG